MPLSYRVTAGYNSPNFSFKRHNAHVWNALFFLFYLLSFISSFLCLLFNVHDGVGDSSSFLASPPFFLRVLFLAAVLFLIWS